MSQGESRGALMERVREAVYDRLDTHLNPVQIATQAADIAVDEVLAAIHERDYTAGDSSDEEVLGIYRHLIRTIYGWMR